MKKKTSVLAALAVAAMLGGCIPSLHPIYTEDKLVFLQELVGNWTNQSEMEINFNKTQQVMGEEKNAQVTVYKDAASQPETWTFKAGENKDYKLIHRDDKGRIGIFDIHVVKLGDDYFMDFYPGETTGDEPADITAYFKDLDEKMNSFNAIHLLAVHTFAKLEVTPNDLKISMFDPEFLGKLLERRQIRIKHEETENGFVLTASPQELQKFAEKYAHEKEAFLDSPTVLVRS